MGTEFSSRKHTIYQRSQVGTSDQTAAGAVGRPTAATAL
jgi:hypothetical protein